MSTTPASRLQSLLKCLPPCPVDQRILDSLVEKALKDSKSKTSLDNKKSQWEYLLKNEIFALAVGLQSTEGRALEDPETKYYDKLQDRLDLVLAFTEHDACEQTFPFTVIQDLLETHTIDSCSHIFSWIELRAERLTEGMVPQKGKALILLRTLNDLLRRLSKIGKTTIFCGRILTFLSGVFPLGERSGVNLRGEYGPMWEGAKEKPKVEEPAKGDKEKEPEGDKMLVDEVKAEDELKRTASSSKTVVNKEDFYNVFWSLQLPFSRPPLFAASSTFNEFRDAVNKVLPVIKEATAKERAMMGSRSLSGSTGSLKRKREPEAADEIAESEYFFAKFLTSPELLDLEIADTHFRRQFLFQLLILLNHLMTFTKTAKSSWSSPRNRSLQMDFTLEQTDAQWVQETINKATEELRQTTPNGRTFADTVNTILERERNWVKWKNELCAPFDREPWAVELDGVKLGLEEATMEARKKMREEPKDWDWKFGSRPLTEIWELGFRDLSDLRNPFQPGEVKDFVKKIKQEDARIDLRKKSLERTAERLAQARAKATAPKAEFPSHSATSTSAGPTADKSQTTPTSTLVPAREASDLSPGALSTAVASAARSLHPSLPAKPGSASPAKSSASSQEIPSVASVIPAVSISSPSLTTSLTTPAVPQPPTVVPAVPSGPSPPDEEIARHEENKQRWSWLALRTARDQYFQCFGKIRTGDIVSLLEDIEKEAESEKYAGEEASGSLGVVAGATGAGDERGASPITTGVSQSSIVVDIKTEGTQGRDVADVEGDIKMEER